MNRTIKHLQIRAINSSASRGVLVLGQRQFPCLLGKNGKTHAKREGDGKSPIGKWRLQTAYYRADKTFRPRIGLKLEPLQPEDGWCDAKTHGQYNTKVHLPFAAAHETLWRTDEAYDVMITTSHNKRPRVKGLGSAIFLHVWREGATYTEGCVALREKDLRKVLAAIGSEAWLVI